MTGGRGGTNSAITVEAACAAAAPHYARSVGVVVFAFDCFLAIRRKFADNGGKSDLEEWDDGGGGSASDGNGIRESGGETEKKLEPFRMMVG